MSACDNEASVTEAIFNTIAQPLLILDENLKITAANRAFFRQFAVGPDETAGRFVHDLGNGQWDVPELRDLLGDVLRQDRRLEDYRVEHTFEHLGRRTMLLTAGRMRREGAGDSILLAIADVTERERLIFELEGKTEFAEKLIDAVREGLLILGWDLRVRSANQSFYEMFRVDPEETEGRLVYELGNGQWDIPELRRLLEEILPEKISFDDFEVAHDFEALGRRVMRLNARRLDHENLILVAIRDVTDLHDEETRQRAFVGELEHRIKNILNNVRALAAQTMRSSRSLEAFSEAFNARLGALARTQELLVKSPSEAVDLHDIVRFELGAVGAEEGRDFTADGPALRLSPRDSQPMGMAIHELTTNAAKYGALSVEAGRIEIGWWIETRNKRPFLAFHWRERGIRIANTRPAKGFGSQVIEESLPHMLGGSAELIFHPDGVACRLEFPLAGGAKERP